MSSPALALQKAIRLRLINTAAVTLLVPAANILDRNERPAPSPSIILGEDQEVDDDFVTLKRDVIRVYSTLHIWKAEPSTTGVKAIAGAIRKAIGRVRRLDLDPDFICADCRVDGVRYLRDPGGEMSHGVLTINSLVRARWSVVI